MKKLTSFFRCDGISIQTNRMCASWPSACSSLSVAKDKMIQNIIWTEQILENTDEET
jgi:hypothetical protein